MGRNSIFKITLFFLISSLMLAFLAYSLGTFYIPKPSSLVSVGEQLPKYTTVIIDAGHGGEDGGAESASGLIEKHVNLRIAEMLRDMLTASGVNVIMTRDEDKLLYDRNVDFQGRKKKLDHAARLCIMQNAENAVFISIHMNSFTDPKYSGLQVWYSQNDTASQLLAQGIQSNNTEMLQPENTRRIKAATSSIFLLNEATCPAVLVECGFLSNVAEAARFETEEYRQKVAFMIFCSICELLNNQSNQEELSS